MCRRGGPRWIDSRQCLGPARGARRAQAQVSQRGLATLAPNMSIRALRAPGGSPRAVWLYPGDEPDEPTGETRRNYRRRASLFVWRAGTKSKCAACRHWRRRPQMYAPRCMGPRDTATPDCRLDLRGAADLVREPKRRAGSWPSARIGSCASFITSHLNRAELIGRQNASLSLAAPLNHVRARCWCAICCRRDCCWSRLARCHLLLPVRACGQGERANVFASIWRPALAFESRPTVCGSAPLPASSRTAEPRRHDEMSEAASETKQVYSGAR